MSKTYKFLPEDFLELRKKIIELEQEVIEFGREVGESTEQSSETWHDNATYDVARFNFETTAAKLQELIVIRNKATLIEPRTQPPDKVVIGSTVKILSLDTGQTQLVKITRDTVK